MKKMKSVSISLSQSPLEMFLGLINQSNNVSLTADDVQVRGPRVIENAVEEMVEVDGVPTPITRNTETDVDVLSDEVQDDFVTFRYQRASLGHLFSVCNPIIREVDIKEEGALSVELIVAEILRKYKLMASIEEFDYELTATQIKLSAKPENLAYLDAANIAIEASLASRVAKIKLNGFNAQAKPDPEPEEHTHAWTVNMFNTELKRGLPTNDAVYTRSEYDFTETRFHVDIAADETIEWSFSSEIDGASAVVATQTGPDFVFPTEAAIEAGADSFGYTEEYSPDMMISGVITKKDGSKVEIPARPYMHINNILVPTESDASAMTAPSLTLTSQFNALEAEFCGGEAIAIANDAACITGWHHEGKPVALVDGGELNLANGVAVVKVEDTAAILADPKLWDTNEAYGYHVTAAETPFGYVLASHYLQTK